MMPKLLTDIPEYKKQKQIAKQLFRQMQVTDISHIIGLLPHRVISHYRPVEDDILWPLKSSFLRLKGIFNQLILNLHKTKRRVRVIKNKHIYQMHVWKKLCLAAHEALRNIVEYSESSSLLNSLKMALAQLNMDVFLCREQAVQIAYLESMRYFSEKQLNVLERQLENIDASTEDKPQFYFELWRALQWTKALRQEWDLLKNRKRIAPEIPVENNVELVFR